MPPGFLVAHVVDHHHDGTGRDERTRATDTHIEHLTAGSRAGDGDQDILGPDVTLVLQTDLLPSEFQAGGVPSRQRNIYSQTEIDFRVVGPAVQR